MMQCLAEIKKLLPASGFLIQPPKKNLVFIASIKLSRELFDSLSL